MASAVPIAGSSDSDSESGSKASRFASTSRGSAVGPSRLGTSVISAGDASSTRSPTSGSERSSSGIRPESIGWPVGLPCFAAALDLRKSTRPEGSSSSSIKAKSGDGDWISVDPSECDAGARGTRSIASMSAS